MKLIISEKQLELILSKESDISEQESSPAAGTSGTQSGGEGYPSVGKWESGAVRGPGNQIGVTKWSDVVGSILKRGKGNPLKEQSAVMSQFYDKNYEDWARKNPHEATQLVALGAAFLPVIGPYLGGAIALADAKRYYDEGDTKNAGLVGMFALLPGFISIVSKIPFIKLLGAKGMSALAAKFSKGAKITNPNEIKVLDGIAKNRQLIQKELDKWTKEMSIRAAKNKVKNQIIKQNLKKGTLNIGGALLGYGAAGGLYNYGYDKIYGEEEMAKLRAEEEANLRELDKIIAAEKLKNQKK